MGDTEHVWSLDEQGRLILPEAVRRDLGCGPETGLAVGTLGRYLLLWEPDRETPLHAHPTGPMQRELLRRLGPCGTTTRWCSSRCWTGLQAHKHAPGQTAGGVIEAISGDF